ncbi:unnamed protein product [Phytophthora fragariaefolia]|uniref:Unnamed protein product n=1 Tax=Phytophthora fragariaefolia TaxID=1490495 RepID=A0A9W7DDV7_9STRA|nr:unnamed protein product [Phytophthora fragariaefolia]
MNNGVRSAIEHGVTDLIIVGDSRLAIHQSMGVIACRKETLQLKLSQHKELTAQLKSTRYLHVVRAYNASADSLATEALESQVTKVVLSESRKTELKALNKIPEVLYVDEQALAETNLPAQRMQPIPQNETHAEYQTVEESQVTAVTRNQSRRLFRRLQGSSSIDELVAALEKEIVGRPHPAVVAGEQQADAFAAQARADLLEHELRETMKRVSQLEESEKTASALVRSLKEQVAQLENRNISLQELHQSTNLERDSWSTERIRLDATIRDKERFIASMTADYHRDAGNRQLVLGGAATS